MPESPPDSKRPGRAGKDADRKAEREWRRLVGLVYEFLAYLLVLGYLGWKLDQERDLKGWGLFGGLLIAMTAWIYRVLRVTRKLFK